jgi:hypothetical protein
VHNVANKHRLCVKNNSSHFTRTRRRFDNKSRGPGHPPRTRHTHYISQTSPSAHLRFHPSMAHPAKRYCSARCLLTDRRAKLSSSPNRTDAAVYRWQLIAAGFQPSLVILSLDDDGHAVMASLLNKQLVRLHGDDCECVHLGFAIG